jgi:anti-sigma factor ChrR (cupin superfamily)
MSSDPPNDIEERAALYLAGALPAEEAEAFAARLERGCPESTAAIARLGGAAGALIDALEPLAPPAAVREALLRRAAAAQPVVAFQTADRARWRPAGLPGITYRTLRVDKERRTFTALVRMEPGSSYPAHPHEVVEECLVIEGNLRVGDRLLGPGDYQLAPPGSFHAEQYTEGGCLLLLTATLGDLGS